MSKRDNQLRDYQAEAGVVVDDFDDDVFAYDGGVMRQCISGFGRNALQDLFCKCKDKEACKQIGYRVNELVRWCRSFNRENHELKKRVAALEAERDTALGRFNIFKAIVHNELDDLGIDKLLGVECRIKPRLAQLKEWMLYNGLEYDATRPTKFPASEDDKA